MADFSELNFLYYLCQCSIGLPPIEAFLYRKLKSCPLKESAITLRIWTNEGTFSLLRPRKSCLFGFLVDEMLQKGLLKDFIGFTPSWSRVNARKIKL
jgi:hypothetical protein